MMVRFMDGGSSRRFSNPSAADDQIALIKHYGLSRRDSALRLIERHAHLAVRSILQHGGRRLMPMANLCLNLHRRVRVRTRVMQAVNGNPVQVGGKQSATW